MNQKKTNNKRKTKTKNKLDQHNSSSSSNVSVSLEKYRENLMKEDGSSFFTRMIRWYEKEGDQLAGELSLPNIKLTELQELFHESSDDLMFECYLINDQQANYFQQKINQKLDLDSYDYFLDCDAI
jgi:hypothetical protein